MIPVIAIFDIGKTNKKFFLFDEDYNITEETSVHFDEIQDEDGFPCEDLNALSKWVIDTLRSFLHNHSYDIRAVNFSAYGASFVHLNENDRPLTPLYNYLKPYPDDVDALFYNTYGDRMRIALETASPALGNLNSGLQLYSLKHSKPDIFSQVATSLHLPQYISYLISGKKFSDITSIGCHTALWDFRRSQYHEWVLKEALDQILPPVHPTDKTINVRDEGKKIYCGIGLHDSSAAFIPYLKNIQDPFLFISTGTWCISMNAFNSAPLTKEELEKDSLCYMTCEGAPVKSSRLFAGHVHEQVTKKMAAHFNVSSHYFEQVVYRNEFLKEETELPALSDFDPSPYKTYEEAYINFMKHLIKDQTESTRLVLNDKIKKIFVDGGFAKNEVYMCLLAEAFPHIEVYAASVTQASALGAAMVIHKEWNQKDMPSRMIRVKRYESLL